MGESRKTRRQASGEGSNRLRSGPMGQVKDLKKLVIGLSKAVKSCQNLSTQNLYATRTASHVFLNASYKSQGFAHGQEMSLGPDRRFAKLHDIGLADWINGRIGRLCE
jgi:hypothetical protein